LSAQVYIGTLADLDKINTEEGGQQVRGFQDRAMWSWLRLQRGRRVDAEIKRAAEDMKTQDKTTVLEELILEHLIDTRDQRIVQYIIMDGEIKAVASTKHLLIPPEEVLQAANEVIHEYTPLVTEQDPSLDGLIVTDENEYAGLYLGFHMDPGNILTRRAISVSSYIRTLICTNPLTFAGIGNFGRFGLEPRHERVLRIHKITELKPRIQAAITEAGGNVENLKKMVNHAKQNQVDPKEARIILSAFSKAYGIGDKVIQELLGRLQEEPSTTYGMSQAASWIARHGESWKKPVAGQAEHARQSMAVVGAASLLVEDPHLTHEKAAAWLRGQWPTWPEWLKP